MRQKSLTGSTNSTSIYPFTVLRFRPFTIRQTTSRPCAFDRMTVCPAGKLVERRRTAPLSKTMTVLPSSRVGPDASDALPFSPGILRIVMGTSRHTGLDRGDSPDLLSEFGAGEPGLPWLLSSRDSLIISVMAF